MKLRKKALLPAIAMVLASVIALSGVTYAWFTTGNTAEVSKLDVNVATANGIQVSLDASSWKSTITSTDFENAIKANLVSIQYPMGNAEINPVSTAGNIAVNDKNEPTGKLAMFDGVIENGALTTSVASETATSTSGNFVAFDLYFKTSSKDQALTLRMGDARSFVKGLDLATTDENGNPVATTIGTEKAVRVAFVVYSGANGTPAAARQNLAVKEVKIWEPNSTTRANGVPEGTESGLLTYYGVNKAFSKQALGSNLIDNGYVTDMTDAFGTNMIYDADTDIITLQPGINKIRVYIWLEGQDVDCVNDISFGDFRVNLYFDVPSEEG